jgi:mannosyl-3-phosphoglycerate phosphatase
MLARNGSFVIFTDVDNILVDRFRSFEESAGAIDLLARNEIPLVLCSGKTRAQLESVHQLLGIRHPFICEHGAAAFIPPGYFADVPDGRSIAGYHVVEFGPPYRDVLERFHLAAARVRVDVVGFNDMSIEEVASRCGLSLMEARLAKLREYDEPFRVVNGDNRERERLARAVRDANLGWRRGDGFDHVGAFVDLDVAVQLLCTLYRDAYGHPSTIGFGVLPGHAALLRTVDHAFVLHDESAPPSRDLLAEAPTARAVATPGPAGWAETVSILVTGDRNAAHMSASRRR